MTELLRDALTWMDLAGEPITIGGGDADIVLGDQVEGLGQPAARTRFTDRHHGGQLRGRSVPDSRTVACDAWLDNDPDGEATETPLERLVASMQAFDRPDLDAPLSWRGLGWSYDPGLRLYVIPTRCEPTIDEDAVNGDAPGLDLEWVACDPTIYSEDETTHASEAPSDLHTFTVTNAGTRASQMSGRAWLLAATAVGTVTDPYIENVTTGQKVTWVGLSIDDGDTLTVDRWRYSYVASTGVDGYAQSPSVPWADYPVLDPGDNTVRVGCATGDLDVELTTRSSW